jgi:hypothetical protein
MHFRAEFKARVFNYFDRISGGILCLKQDVCIQGGPFQGMRYLTRSVGSLLLPKILGAYELELFDVIESLPHFELGLDIGAAEGYYAVGLLRKGTCARMIAWEMTPEGQALMDELAKSNGVADRITIGGMCTPESLSRALGEARDANVLIVVDCEGYEGELLETVDASLFRNCTLIIETHDFAAPGVHDRLCRLFKRSHHIIEIEREKRRHSDLTAPLQGLLGIFGLPLISRIALAERRLPKMKWLVCKARSPLGVAHAQEHDRGWG